jgi:hypothetical protein
LGFSPIYRYVAGKRDWFAFDLPMKGDFAVNPKAIDVVRHDVPTTDHVGEVYKRCQEIGCQVCLVLNEAKIVLGRLRRDAWHASPETPVEQVMEDRPTPFHPDNFLEPLTKRMQEKKVGTILDHSFTSYPNRVVQPKFLGRQLFEASPYFLSLHDL